MLLQETGSQGPHSCCPLTTSIEFTDRWQACAVALQITQTVSSILLQASQGVPKTVLPKVPLCMRGSGPI